MNDRCELSDLPTDQCACRIHKQSDPLPEYEVAVRFPARFGSTLDCGHRASEGDPIARTTEGDFICEECAYGVELT